MSALETVAWRWKNASQPDTGKNAWVATSQVVEGDTKGYDVQPLTPLAPAQAEIARLQSLLDDANEARNTAEGEAHLLRERARMLSSEHASIVAMMRRWIKMIDDPERQENGLSESLLLGIRRGASQTIAALAAHQSTEQKNG